MTTDNFKETAKHLADMLAKVTGELTDAQEVIGVLVGALKAVEWAGWTVLTYGIADPAESVPKCPICQMTKDEGHAPDCTTGAALMRGKAAR